MTGAATAFKSKYPDLSLKVDTDPAITPAERASFWAELDQFDSVEIEEAFDECCDTRQMSGAVVVIHAGEELGHAAARIHLLNNLSQNPDPTSGLPPPARNEVEVLLNRVANDPNRARAASLFTLYFGGVRIATIPRIYAFRSDSAGINPLDIGSLRTIFERLAIPSGEPTNYVMVAFQPEFGYPVKVPTCFDARMRNLEAFQPGGVTAPVGLPGLPEVVTPPPLCGKLSEPPRTIA